MRDDREMKNRQIKAPVSGWHSLVRTNLYFRKEGWLNLLRSPVSDIIIVSTDIEGRLVEEAGHPAVVIEDDVAAVVFTSAVETLLDEGYFIPPLLLLVQSLDGLTTTERILYLSLAKMTPIELVIGDRYGSSIQNLVDVSWEDFVELLDAAYRKIMKEEYGVE